MAPLHHEQTRLTPRQLRQIVDAINDARIYLRGLMELRAELRNARSAGGERLYAEIELLSDVRTSLRDIRRSLTVLEEPARE